jgi:4-carboxymuconolactone decarboxylase
MGEEFTESPGISNIMDTVHSIDAVFSAGVVALNDVIHGDGALSGRDKAVLLVAGAAVRDRVGTAAEVERAIGLGVERAELETLALALYLSRGVGPCRAVLDALPGTTRPANMSTTPVSIPSVPAMVDAFRQIFGEVPDRISLLADASPSGLAAYHLMRGAVLGSGRLTPIIAELALLTVNACEHRADFAAVHVAGARQVGATEAQLVEAGLCGVPSGGVAAWLSASEAIVSTRTPGSSNSNSSIDPSN